MKSVLAVLILACSGLAQAQTQLIGTGVNDSLYREGTATYSNLNGVVATSWFSLQSKNSADSGKWLMQVHCDTRLIRTIRTVAYYHNVPIADSGENWQSLWRNPVPSSLEALFQAVCTQR